ncbi:MFS transporter [Burkholderia sp. FERM BP-3421]|uniref:MFS transporter n=1 Tax=Burkholderia sp. FERM BP-3421 TaxID=1494466 RepID=UPI002361AE23|nr:MFS transporter [Burkholderia sp. FERM BP-3421]WDD91825.1 MFS transporter [Burkholderia sp. FERM BP-3421]
MNRPLWTLLVFHGLDKLLFFAITPNKPLSAWQAGWLSDAGLALFFVIQIFLYRLFPLLGGFLADRYPGRLVIAFGSAVQALGLTALCQADTPLTLFAAGGIAGIGGGILNPAVYSILSQVSGKQGGRAFSTHYLLINVGAMAGPLLLWPSLGSTSLWLLLPLSIAVAGVLAIPVAQQRTPGQPGSTSWFAPLRDPFFIKVFALFSAIWACYTMIFSSAPLIAAELGLRPRGNIWLGLNSATVLFAYLWTMRRPASAGIAWRSVSIGLGLTTAGVLAVGVSPNDLAVGAGVVVLSIGEFMSIPVLYHLVSEHAPAQARSRYFGFIWVAGAIGEAGAQALLWICPQPRLVCILAAATLGAAMLLMRAVRARTIEINTRLTASQAAS